VEEGKLSSVHEKEGSGMYLGSLCERMESVSKDFGAGGLGLTGIQVLVKVVEWVVGCLT
jgi:hypothetical protein